MREKKNLRAIACDPLRYALMAHRREINRRVMHFDEKPLSPDPLALARL